MNIFKVLKNQYINDLVEKINYTEIWSKGSDEYLLYDMGIEVLLNAFRKHKRQKSKLFFVGNGGSSAIASHMTADFMKNGGMNTYSLYDSAVLTCMGNDYGYEYIFSRQLDFLMKEGDLLVAISSSGNSLNIINAIKTAKEKNASIITFTGFETDNKVKQMGDINVYVPCKKYGIVESIHNIILQQIVDLIIEKDSIEFPK